MFVLANTVYICLLITNTTLYILLILYITCSAFNIVLFHVVILTNTCMLIMFT